MYIYIYIYIYATTLKDLDVSSLRMKHLDFGHYEIDSEALNSKR